MFYKMSDFIFDKITKYKKKEKMRTISGVPGKVAKFSQKLHDKYDIEGRNMVKQYLKDDVIDNPDIYGVDMILTKPDFPYKFIEVQVYANWQTDEFPYSKPYIYARKMRYGNDTLFVAYNRNFTKLLMFGRSKIIDKPERLKKYDREFVHYVNWNNVFKINAEDLSMDTIELYYS
jgi:hypothetical protein